MSIIVTARCKICNCVYKNVQIYNRQKYEEEGYECRRCQNIRRNQRRDRLCHEQNDSDLIEEFIPTRFDILDL